MASCEGSGPAVSPSPGVDAGTIVAISTPTGRGCIGVVRLSGPRAIDVARRVFHPPRGEADRKSLPPGRVIFGCFAGPDGGTIDHGYLVIFRPPASFTGEESAELWTHGSPAVTRLLVEAAVTLGARPATPGEFTLRAFLNGRIDATQAEAIRDLIEARTAFQVKVAHDQVQGRVSSAVDHLKDRLVEIVARLEASVEFSEEDEAGRFLPEGGVAAELDELRRDIETLAGSYDRGRRVREGATVALVGAPNVGKSSLFNRLLEEDRAIVTPIAGTTRDILEETLDLRGIPVTLLDTAGLHESPDEAGAEAVRRARVAMTAADRLLLVFDWSRPFADDDRALLRDLDPGRTFVVLNKIDRPCGIAPGETLRLKERFGALEVSAKTGAGMEPLRRRLEEALTAGAAVEREDAFITNVRHRDLLTKASAALAYAEHGARDGVTEEYLLLDCREALDRLGEITGEVGVDDIYDRIFKNFCIGK